MKLSTPRDEEFLCLILAHFNYLRVRGGRPRTATSDVTAHATAPPVSAGAPAQPAPADASLLIDSLHASSVFIALNI